jgi:hypothetical protein
LKDVEGDENDSISSTLARRVKVARSDLTLLHFGIVASFQSEGGIGFMSRSGATLEFFGIL